MATPHPLVDEAARVAALARTGLLDSAPEERFDRLTRLTRDIFDVEVVAVSLVDTDRQWFKSGVGLDVCQTPRDISMCTHAILGSDALVVEDVCADPRFVGQPLMAAMGMRFYAGHPIRDDAGFALGTLCMLDREPRRFSDRDRVVLEGLAAQVRLEVVGLDRDRARARFESTIEAMAEGLMVITRDGGVVELNRAGRRLLDIDHFAPGAFRCLAEFGRVLDDDGSELHQDAHPGACTLATGEPVDSRVIGLQPPGRPVLWLAVSCRPLFGTVEAAPPEGVVITFSDVSHAREVERMKTEFVSVVSHELRTPLTTIRGALGLLDSGVFGTLDPEGAQVVSMALANADRLGRLISDFLDIERIESGGARLEPVTVDVGELVAQAVEIVSPLADDCGVAVVAAVESVRTVADPDRLVQVLVNLLSNAVKFSDAGAQVQVVAEAVGSVLRIQVIDQGRGIPRAKLGTIFDRFGQVDASDSREKGGTGLGLAICRAIAEQHGGSITVSSRLGRGSTFTVELPTSGPGGSLERPSPPEPIMRR